jgi:hypothetical protein
MSRLQERMVQAPDRFTLGPGQRWGFSISIGDKPIMSSKNRAAIALSLLCRSHGYFNASRNALRVRTMVTYMFVGGFWLFVATVIEATVKKEPAE